MERVSSTERAKLRTRGTGRVPREKVPVRGSQERVVEAAKKAGGMGWMGWRAWRGVGSGDGMA